MGSLLHFGLGLLACGLSQEPAGGAPSADAEAIAVSRWTDGHELFVELDAPVAGGRFNYAAHVTRLVDNHAASAGALTLRFQQDGFTVETHTDEAIAREGVFIGEAVAPLQVGTYDLSFVYSDGDEYAAWEAGQVSVGGDVGEAHAPEREGEIRFLKESQWQIPFQVAPAAEVALAPAVSAAAVARPSPGGTAVVAAPVEGLLAWTEALPVVGRVVRRGERLATLIPAGAAEHWGRLQADLTTARIDREQAGKELRRVAGLAEQALLPGRRLEQARAELARAEAEAGAAAQRVAALTSGGAGAVPVWAPADGLIVSVGAGHGEAVAAGAPLVSVSSGGGVLLEGRVHTRTRGALTPVVSLSVMRGDWDAPRDLLADGALLLTERLVFDPDTLSAPVTVLVDGDIGLAPGDLVELRIGVGAPPPRLAVPRGAVVEINGQDVIFVQETGESFSRRRVTLGESDAAHVEILSGLKAGERVVVDGGFDVHVASLSGALESHRH